MASVHLKFSGRSWKSCRMRSLASLASNVSLKRLLPKHELEMTRTGSLAWVSIQSWSQCYPHYPPPIAAVLHLAPFRQEEAFCGACQFATEMRHISWELNVSNALESGAMAQRFKEFLTIWMGSWSQKITQKTSATSYRAPEFSICWSTTCIHLEATLSPRVVRIETFLENGACGL